LAAEAEAVAAAVSSSRALLHVVVAQEAAAVAAAAGNALPVLLFPPYCLLLQQERHLEMVARIQREEELVQPTLDLHLPRAAAAVFWRPQTLLRLLLQRMMVGPAVAVAVEIDVEIALPAEIADTVLVLLRPVPRARMLTKLISCYRWVCPEGEVPQHLGSLSHRVDEAVFLVARYWIHRFQLPFLT